MTKLQFFFLPKVLNYEEGLIYFENKIIISV